jgi:hypothetical protein
MASQISLAPGESGRLDDSTAGTVNLPLLTIPLGQVRILIWKIVVRRMTSEVVKNTGESSFGEGQAANRLRQRIAAVRV